MRLKTVPVPRRVVLQHRHRAPHRRVTAAEIEMRLQPQSVQLRT